MGPINGHGFGGADVLSHAFFLIPGGCCMRLWGSGSGRNMELIFVHGNRGKAALTQIRRAGERFSKSILPISLRPSAITLCCRNSSKKFSTSGADSPCRAKS